MTPTPTVEATPEVTAQKRPAKKGASKMKKGASKLLEGYGLLLLTIVTAGFFSLYSKTSDTFPTLANFQIVLAGQSVVAIVAIGALIPLVASQWDLSIGATAGLSAVFGASLVSNGMSLTLAILAAVAIATTIGVVNALLVTRLGVNAIIATLGMSVIIQGIVNQKTGGLAVVSDLPQTLIDLGQQNLFGVPRLVYVTVVVGFVAYYLLDHTPMGRYLYALGSNPAAAHLVGIPTRLLLGSTFVIGALLCGIAGILQISYSGGASPSVGPSFTLPALAAAFLSAAAVKPGKFNVWGTLVALLFLATLNSGLNLAGAPPYVTNYVNGAALIVGVALASYLGRLRARART